MRQPQVSKSAPSKERHSNHHDEAQEEAECRGGLNPAGVEAALARGCVLADISRGTAILAAERESLQQSQDDKQNRCEHPDRCVSWAAAR